LTTLPPITLQQSLAAGLLFIFIFGGYEVVPVPAGESLDPRRDVPFAMVATIVVVMIVMTLTQIVAQGVRGLEGGNGMTKDAQRVVAAALAGASRQTFEDESLLKEHVRVELKRFIQKETGAKPVIVPVIQQI